MIPPLSGTASRIVGVVEAPAGDTPAAVSSSACLLAPPRRSHIRPQRSTKVAGAWRDRRSPRPRSRGFARVTSGITPAHVGHATSLGGSCGPPSRIFADASVNGIENTRVAASSLRVGGRNVLPPARQPVFHEMLQRSALRGGISHFFRRSKTRDRAIVDRVVEARAGEHEAFDDGHRQTHFAASLRWSRASGWPRCRASRRDRRAASGASGSQPGARRRHARRGSASLRRESHGWSPRRRPRACGVVVLGRIRLEPCSGRVGQSALPLSNSRGGSS